MKHKINNFTIETNELRPRLLSYIIKVKEFEHFNRWEQRRCLCAQSPYLDLDKVGRLVILKIGLKLLYVSHPFLVKLHGRQAGNGGKA